MHGTVCRLPVVMLFLAAGLAGEAPGLDEILQEIHAWYALQTAEIFDVECLGRSIYRELNRNGETVEEIIALRRIYTRGSNEEHEQYIAMSKNGRDLTEREMEDEIQRWRKMGKRRGSTRMPFDPAFQDSYIFTLEGIDTLDNTVAWRIAFQAKEKAEDYIDGVAYVRTDTYRLLRLDAVSSKLPSVIKKMKRRYTYMDVGGYVLPATFEMEIHVKVKFIITFADKHIKIEDSYSDYKLNTGIPDSLFSR